LESRYTKQVLLSRNDKLTSLTPAQGHEASRSSNGIIKSWNITCKMKKKLFGLRREAECRSCDHDAAATV